MGSRSNTCRERFGFSRKKRSWVIRNSWSSLRKSLVVISRYHLTALTGHQVLSSTIEEKPVKGLRKISTGLEKGVWFLAPWGDSKGKQASAGADAIKRMNATAPSLEGSYKPWTIWKARMICGNSGAIATYRGNRKLSLRQQIILTE